MLSSWIAASDAHPTSLYIETNARLLARGEVDARRAGDGLATSRTALHVRRNARTFNSDIRARILLDEHNRARVIERLFVLARRQTSAVLERQAQAIGVRRTREENRRRRARNRRLVGKPTPPQNHTHRQSHASSRVITPPSANNPHHPRALYPERRSRARPKRHRRATPCAPCAPSRARHRRKIFHAIYPRTRLPPVVVARDTPRRRPRAPDRTVSTIAISTRSMNARARAFDRCHSHATTRRDEDTYGDDFFAAVVFTLAVTLIEEAVMENIVESDRRA